MAKYWVGGTGNWNDPTNHWATTDGGLPGAGNIPTATDDVHFTALSNATAYTCTINATAVCLSFLVDANPLTSGVPTLAGSSGLTISGNLSLLSGMTNNYTGGITFNATSGTKTIASNTVKVKSTSITLNGAGGTFQLSDTLNWATGTNVVIANTAGTFSHNNQLVKLDGGLLTVQGNTLTFYDLTIIGVDSTSGLAATTGPTIANTLTVTGANTRDRAIVKGGSSGSTITANTVSLTDVDFQDITGAGTASPFTGTHVGDCGGNVSVTCDTPKTVYGVGNAAISLTSGTPFAQTSGGAGSLTWHPLPQDTVVFDNSTWADNTARVVTFNFRNCPGVDFSTLTRTAKTFTVAGATSVFNGPTYRFASVVGFTTGVALTFKSNTTQNITMAGIQWATGGGIAVGVATQKPNIGTLKLLDALVMGGTLTAGNIQLNSGTFDANNQNITMTRFASTTSTTRTIKMGSGTWTITDSNTTVWSMATETGLTIINDDGAGNLSTVDFTYSGSTGTRTFSKLNGSTQYLGIVKVSAGTDTFAMADCLCVDFIWTGFGGTWTGTNNMTFQRNLTLASGITQSFSGSLTCSGAYATATLTSSAKTFSGLLSITKTSGTFTFSGDFTTTSASGITYTGSGTFNDGGVNVTVGVFSCNTTNTRTVTLGAGTWTLTTTGALWTLNTTNLTLTHAGTIKINNATSSSKTFTGSGLTYNNIWFSGAGTGALIIASSNTFNNFKVDTAPKTVTFTAGTTQTIRSLTAVGTAGNLITFGSSTTSAYTISAVSGLISGDFMSVSYMTGSGGARFFVGANSTNGGNNKNIRYCTSSYRRGAVIGNGTVI
jgi:hypothetical protein